LIIVVKPNVNKRTLSTLGRAASQYSRSWNLAFTEKMMQKRVPREVPDMIYAQLWDEPH
jgi:hypothetical protein